MIFVGNDIVDISRIDRLLKKYKSHFLNKIFTKDEIDIVHRKFHTSIHLAGKFAAKEASKKALMAAGFYEVYEGKPITFKAIEVLNKEDGAPYIVFKDVNQKKINSIVAKIQVSISHTNNYATAVAILETSSCL